MKVTRTFVKSALWEITSFIVQTIILWYWFGSLPKSVSVNIVLLIIKTILLTIYLSMWKRTRWLK